MSIWDTRMPTVPLVPVAPGFSLHAELRASVRARIEVPSSLVCIAFSPMPVRERLGSRDLQFLSRIDQIRITDEVFVSLVNHSPLVGVPILPLGDFRETVPFDDHIRLSHADRARRLKR